MFFYFFTFVVLVLSVFFSFVFLKIRRNKLTKNVCIVVLGDVGRSPRMQNHTLSCVKAGLNVHLVGFGGSKLITELQDHKNVSLVILGDFPKALTRLPRLLYYGVKAVYQFLQLFIVLFSCALNSSHLIVQSVPLAIPTLAVAKPTNPIHLSINDEIIIFSNPPAIPTLAVAWVSCILCNCKLVIDWHNYGYTILALGLGNPQHILLKIAKWYEHGFGRLSSYNFCVTQAMKEDLEQNWQIRADTLYDRPPERFQTTDIETKHNLFLKLSKDYSCFGQTQRLPEFATKVVEEITAFTVKNSKGMVYDRDDRPALLVSSTSWTEDEDFSVLLEALEDYEENASKEGSSFPKIVCAITGKGPLKEYYKSIIATKNFKSVSICTPWLEPDDYPRLLGSADLGICLHKSSSGLDLPMKVVDMFGCGLPVCAINFKCLPELVKHEENGLIFQDGAQLANQIKQLLHGFPKNQKTLQNFRNNLKSFQQVRWDDTWNKVVLPVLKS